MATKKKNIEEFWITLFILLPVLVFGRLGTYFTDNTIFSILLAGLLGGMGGLLGGGVYRLVKQKSILVKIVGLIVIFGIGVCALFLTNRYTKNNLNTCEVCGYKSLQLKDTLCNICDNKIWDNKYYSKEFSSKKEWLRDAQLMYFEMDSINQKVNFHKPDFLKGCKKDESWRPSISEKDLRNDFESYLEN